MLAVTGITNKSLRALMTGLLGGATYTRNQASYDLARLRVNGLVTRVPEETATGSPATDYGLRSSTPNCTIGYCARCLPQTTPWHHHHRKALRTIDIHITQTIDHARVLPNAA